MPTTSLTMNETLRDERGVEVFDRCLGASLLAPFAEDMSRRLGRLQTGSLLELAAGTGALTRVMIDHLSTGIAITATDPDPVLVQAGRRDGSLARVLWQQADPTNLPFDNESFGIIVCQFGVATLADHIAVLREVRRVMIQGGRFLFSVPGPLRVNPVTACVQATLCERYPGDPPPFLALGLHGYADDEIIDEHLTVAGFTDAMYTNVDLPFTATADMIAVGYCLGTPLRAEIERRDPGGLDLTVECVTEALIARFGSSTIRSGMRSLVVSASA